MRVRAWIDAFRLKFLPQGVVPVLLGTAIAWSQDNVFYFGYFLLAFFGMMLVQFGLTMLNDWYDFVQGTDTSNTTEKNPYTGGSGVLVDGIIKPNEMITVIAIFYIIAFFIASYFTIAIGPMVMYIALCGFFISIFYSLKPFQFAYRGLGELMMLLGYGPTITLGAYFVQAQRLTWQVFLAGLIPGMLMWAMIIINEIPDYEEDSKANKRNLVVRFGREVGKKLYVGGLSIIYLFIILCVVWGVFPVPALLALLSIPFALKSVRYMRRYYLDVLEMAPANKEMVKVYSSTTLLLILGFLLDKVIGV
ncbi:MAG: 1,4-dihydroxy-2-naphthoate octaprenyltransferase [Candidatus Hydrothermarchaeales archaeon]